MQNFYKPISSACLGRKCHKVLLQQYSSATKYYLYYKVLLQYYPVLQSTTPVLTCTTKYPESSTPVLTCD